MNASDTRSIRRAPATARTQPSRIARCRRAVALCTLTAGLAAILAPAAQATTRVENPGNGTLSVIAAAGKTNAITVTRPGQLVIRDTGDTVTPGNGCTQIDSNSVSCLTGGIATISVLSGDLNDRIVYNAAGPPGAHGPRGALSGGTGNDAIRLGGSAWSSDLNGGAGNDSLLGAAGHDVFDGGDGADVFTGGTGIDAVSYRSRTTPVIADIDGVADDGASGESDNIRGDIENVFGGSANDALTGSALANRLFGGQGNDSLNGLAGNDELLGDAGNDNLSGGDGDDTATYGAGVDGVDGSDRFSGGADRDMASYRGHARNVNVSLDGIANDGTAGEGDNNLSDVENVQGTRGDDTLTGNGAANSLTGLTGSDRLFGLAGSDTLNTVDGISANDSADGGIGIDTCVTDPGDARTNCES
jgi:Ca2+-binding RTX toxin-like protein